MDPIKNIQQQRFYAQSLLRRIEANDFGEDFKQDADRLADLVLALDSWRLTGGFDPYAVGT